MSDPYRTPDEPIYDPRWAAETDLIKAKAKVYERLAEGMQIANTRMANGLRASEFSLIYETLQDFYESTIGRLEARPQAEESPNACATPKEEP